MIRAAYAVASRALMTSTTLHETQVPSLPKDRIALQNRTFIGTLALGLGLGIIFLVGFAPVSAVHNAAHDTRHSAAFPCH